MRSVVPVLIVGLLVAVAAPSTAGAADRRTSFSSARLTQTIAANIRKAKIPGAIVGVWRGNRQLYKQGVGVSNLKTKAPLNVNGYQRIGSVTKSFVVTGILQLVDHGQMGLDDPISKYLPGVVPNGDNITIRELAEMRSGIYSYTNTIIPSVIASDPDHQWTTSEILAIAFGQAPLFLPGTDFDYSNSNTIILGLALEAVTGQPLEAYLKRNILRPEHLRHTSLPADAEFPSPHSRGYTNWTPQGLGDDLVDATDWSPSWGWAAGGMISNIDDLRHWARDVATGTLLKPATQRERTKFRTAPGEGGATYGLALQNYNGWISHDGNIAGYVTYPFYLPAERTTMVVAFNSNANPLGSAQTMRAITKVITPKHLWPIPTPD